MERWIGRVALVTGASSGIGAAICTALVENGMQVIGAARRLENIQEHAELLKGKKGKLIPYRCDVTKDAEINKLFEYIRENFTSFDVCINNAGAGANATLLDIDPEMMRKNLDLNVVAVCLCSKLSVALMREKKVNDGHILNIGSVMGHKVYRFHAAHFYTATKYAVRALTEGLRQELKGLHSGIRVSLISPGYVKTEATAPFLVMPEFKDIIKDSIAMAASDIADAVVYILSAPATVEINDLIIAPTFDVNLDRIG